MESVMDCLRMCDCTMTSSRNSRERTSSHEELVHEHDQPARSLMKDGKDQVPSSDESMPDDDNEVIEDSEFYARKTTALGWSLVLPFRSSFTYG